MAIPGMTGDMHTFVEKLKDDIAKSVGCEGGGSFIDTAKDLAAEYYSYFRCDVRGPVVRSLVDIQAEIELSENNMKDFEQFSKNLANVSFTLRALGIEIEKIQESTQQLYDEIMEFWVVVKGIESQNYKIIKVLTSIWKVLRDLKKNLYVLSTHQKRFIEDNLTPSMISFSEYIECSKDEELNALLKSFGSKSMYFAETIRQMKYMNELLLSHQKLKSVHPMFSFQLLLLINQPKMVNSSDPVKVKKLRTSRWWTCPCLQHRPVLTLIRSPDTVLNSIEKQVVHVGTLIHKTTQEIKNLHCASVRREQIVMAEVQAKRIAFLRGLSELQNIMGVLTEMDDSNDTLVGMMTKTRPLFKRINEYLKIDLSKVQSLVETESSQTVSLNSL